MASFVSEPVIGPLVPFAEGFLAQLTDRGYSVQALKSHRGLLVHLSQWLAERGLGVRELTPEIAARFLQMRRDAGFVTKVSDRGLQPLVSYLRELGELSEPSVSSSPSEELVEQFRRYQRSGPACGRPECAAPARPRRRATETADHPIVGWA